MRTISSERNIRMHELGSRRFGATTAGPLQLDGASLLWSSQPEHRSIRKELEEGVRGDAHSPERRVVLGTYYAYRLSLSTRLAPEYTA